MKPLRATQLPKLRADILTEFDRSVDYCADALEFARTVGVNNLHPDDLAELPTITSLALSIDIQSAGISTGDMWWVSADMATLAVDTAIDDMELPALPELQPGEAGGLIYFQGGITIQLGPTATAIDALTWAPYHGAQTGIAVWQRTEHGVRSIGLDAMGVDAHTTAEFLGRLAIATTLLAGETTVAEARQATFARDGDPRDTRNRPVPGVTVINVRPRPNPTRGPNGEPVTGEREYTHRWIVRGHMHTYRHGKGRARTRKRWVAPYVAGPEDKPLIVKEHVWALRGTGARDRAA
ncbi:hypothetical protein [Tsukamurella pseudospumae]|uniref:Uncharacterized protein n=1 Tax=Tsukamurella pseudospumae TaxID=239498 RepID=A0A138AEI7_9ACTN|nr:hypothetical protein [Tsukamurella pseudospumae]KXP08789.1 hypothetical protein AXK60_08985 [Tsukamurella pseudospumae]